MRRERLLKAILEAEIEGPEVGPDDIGQLPGMAGAYVLLIHRKSQTEVRITSLPHSTLAHGWYVYLGSARGPGGIRSRLQRHFRQDKPVHWHIDRLTVGANNLAAIAVDKGQECDLVRKLATNSGFTFPISRFGSSDCRLCESHLLQADLA